MKSQLPEYIKIINTRDKKSNLKTIKYKGKYLHSPYNPLKEAGTELEKYPDCSKYEIIIIFGLGMGYMLDLLQEKICKSDIKIIGIEYEENFKYFFKEKQYKNPVTFFFNKDCEKACSFLYNYLDRADLKKILFIESRPIMEINPEYYQYIKKNIKHRLQQKAADVTTTAYFNRQWLFNSFVNLHNLKNFILINDLKHTFLNKTALLVSSGPSVENDIDYIKNFKGYIFCLPPSINFLLKNKIIPDFIILGDSNFSNIYHLKKALKSNIFLLTDLSIHYTLLSKWSGMKVLFSYNIPGFEYIDNRLKIDYIPQGGTIASSALAIMKYLGFKRVVLFGQDFAYNDLQLHVKGSGYEVYHSYRNNRFKNFNDLNFLMIKDNQCEYKDGKIIDHKLKLYKDWFYKLVKSFNITIEKKDHTAGEDKKSFKVTVQKGFSLKKELIKLKEKLDLLQEGYGRSVKKKATVEEFIKDLEKDKEIHELLKGFNYQHFLKLKQGLEIDRKEFFSNIISGLEKIEWLVDYNLQG